MPHTNTFELERAVRTKVQDMESLSADLDMQASFVRKFKAIYPLLVQLGQQDLADQSQQQFYRLMNTYEVLGTPERVHDEATRGYLSSVQRFSDVLSSRILALYPLDDESLTTALHR